MKTNKTLIISSLVMLIVGINLVSAGFYYNVSIKYDNGKMNIQDVNVIFSQIDRSSSNGDYYLDLIQNKDSLNQYAFKVPNTIMYDNEDESGKINGGGVITLNQTEFEIYIPYLESADEIVIADANKIELAKKDVSYLSKNVVSKQVTNEFQNSNSNNKSEKTSSANSSNMGYWIIAILIILILIVFFIIWSRSKKKHRIKKKN